MSVDAVPMPSYEDDQRRRNDALQEEVATLRARLAAAEARAERAVGMVRRAYSIGYSAGCAGAPHSVRVDDLAALLKEVSHEG